MSCSARIVRRIVLAATALVPALAAACPPAASALAPPAGAAVRLAAVRSPAAGPWSKAGPGWAVAAGGHGSVIAATAGRPSAASAVVSGAGHSGPRSAVPWRQVGSGWVLALYWPGRYAGSGTALAAVPVLYLIGPAGGRYQLYRWPVTKNPPILVDWSADKTDALVSLAGGTLEEVDLASGTISPIPLPSQVQVIGYTRPGGRGLFGWWRRASFHWQLNQYSLSGHRIKGLFGASTDHIAVVYSPDGSALAAGFRGGLWVTSNKGPRTLRVPARACFPVRWWNSGTILASCQATETSRYRLWLVHAGGGVSPIPLTAQRGSKSADPGDIGAWQLPGRLYLQALTSSGSGLIFTQAANGQAARIVVPGTAGDNWIMTARGSQLLLRAQTRCSDHQSLLWFNPATRHEQPLLTAPPGLAGVIGAVPYGPPVARLDIQVACA